MGMVSYEEFRAAVGKAKLGIGPAELHGSITGYLCAALAPAARE